MQDVLIESFVPLLNSCIHLHLQHILAIWWVWGEGFYLAHKVSIDFCGIFLELQEDLIHIPLIDKEGHDIQLLLQIALPGDFWSLTCACIMHMIAIISSSGAEKDAGVGPQDFIMICTQQDLHVRPFPKLWLSSQGQVISCSSQERNSQVIDARTDFLWKKPKIDQARWATTNQKRLHAISGLSAQTRYIWKENSTRKLSLTILT